MKSGFDAVLEISKFPEIIQKRCNFLDNENIAADTPGLHVVCPTQWIVHAVSLQSAIIKFSFKSGSLKKIIERNSLARNIDVDFLFDIFWDHYFMSLCQQLKDKNYTNLSMKVLQGLRSASQFKLFVMLNLSCFAINSPTLSHKHSARSNVETKVVGFSMKIF